MEGREIRIKLDYNKPKRTESERKEINEIIESNDEKYKNKFNANRRTKERKFIPGDCIRRTTKEKQMVYTILTSILYCN